MAIYVDPLVGAECDVQGWQEGTKLLYGVDILHTERLAVAHNRAGILGVEHILGHHRNILGAHI